ncbi:endonuclease/exonuclease/phosphatase family protein [Corallococcus macrosporus]|uniref:Endonuclease/exonuclease/phosphatase domain-containing protein n=1 Tax=Corallococcus macrosporus DSM 14697 TaxID=1189310 RepID=A0A250JSV1_9BACT|nr:endonuclease/exonuclease/phosphatase family protein [Corallococcus macrosporus]ATB46562.1 hypothetical protein MYMAC_002167 [Corallococcus macrosporus DSM 14697]
MIVAYWNTQRASGLESSAEGPQSRCIWCCEQLLRWIHDTVRAHQAVPSLIFLSEVSQGGGPMAAFLSRVSGYQARYIPAGDRNNNPSPCSYIIMWREELNPRIEVVGASQKRPVLRVRVRGLTVGGVHIIANRQQAPDEIFGDIAELNQEQQPAVLLGDMNYPWEQLAGSAYQPGLSGEIKDLFDWTPVNPGLLATYGKQKKSGALKTETLDYLWRSSDVSRIEAIPPIPGYNQWRMIDHAPIAYRIHLNGEDEVMDEAAASASLRPRVEPRRRALRTS